MKILVLILLCCVCMLDWAVADVQTYIDHDAFSSAVGSVLTEINFDTVPTGTILDQQFAGLDFNSFDDGIPKAISYDGAPSLPNALITHEPVSSGGGGFEVIFSFPVKAVGLYLGDLQFTGNTFEIFDTLGSSLGLFDVVQYTGPGPGYTNFLFFGVIADQPIAKLQVDVPSNDAVRFDNFEYALACEPQYSISGNVTDAMTGEPIVWALMFALKLGAAPRFTLTGQGSYEFDNLEPGTWHLITLKHGYQAGYTRVEVTGIHIVDIELYPKTASRKGITSPHLESELEKIVHLCPFTNAASLKLAVESYFHEHGNAAPALSDRGRVEPVSRVALTWGMLKCRR